MQYDRFDQIELGHAAQFEVTIDNEKMAFFLVTLYEVFLLSSLIYLEQISSEKLR